MVRSIQEELRDFNPWWIEKFELKIKDREVYKQIRKFLHMPQIIAFTGLRRVGKTTLMKKILTDYLAEGFESKNIIYFSFDEFKNISLKEILKVYEELFSKEIKNQKSLVLFDEIQKLEDWENQIKVVYDLYKDKMKIIISGSESLFIKTKSKESLAGRIFEFKISPLNFREFLEFNEKKFDNLKLHEKEIFMLFNEFIYCQGFPELIGVKEKDVITKYIKEGIVDRIVYKDIPELFKIKDISVLSSILRIFMEEPGQIIELADLASELKISRQTLALYLKYLEDSYLIRKAYNFSRNKRKTEKKLKKYYPSIISPVLLFKEDDLYKSKVFECFLVNQLNAEFFWRDKLKNEVDVIIANKELTPIEIKYGKIETKGLSVFMKKFKVKKGYIISSEKEQIQKIDKRIISIVPAFKFLLKQEEYLK